ncbi:MAG: SDR family NAD(P)-dependent oxidoreductase [Candidatus Micrarchaeota archaeon]
MLKNKTALVTGGAGFVGSHLAEALAEKGVNVRVLDNFDRGRIEYLNEARKRGSVEVISGDVRDKHKVEEVMKGVDFVFHEAAVCLNKSVKFPEEAIDVNVWGTTNVVRAAVKENVEKFLFASSASVYGNPRTIPMTEDHGFYPESPYCVSKIAGEYFIKIHAKNMDYSRIQHQEKPLDYSIFRYFNIYGLRQPTDAYYTSVILSFIKKFDKNEKPVIHGDGTQTMDFVHVRDIVQANLLALENPQATGETFNVASGTETSINDIVCILNEIFGTDIKPEYKTEVAIYVKRRLASIDNAREKLGFTPSIALKDGLKEIVDDYKAHPELY